MLFSDSIFSKIDYLFHNRLETVLDLLTYVIFNFLGLYYIHCFYEGRLVVSTLSLINMRCQVVSHKVFEFR